jgi:hypothetical protein
MFSKPPKEDKKALSEASAKVDSLTQTLKAKVKESSGDGKMQRLSQQADSLTDVLTNRTFEKPATQEMVEDFIKLQTLLEDYRASLSTKAIPIPGSEEEEVKEDTSATLKLTKVDELLKDVTNRDFASLADKWAGHTTAIASHRDVGGDNSFLGGLTSIVKPIYNQYVGSAGYNLVQAMQPIYQDLETKAQAQRITPKR